MAEPKKRGRPPKVKPVEQVVELIPLIKEETEPEVKPDWIPKNKGGRPKGSIYTEEEREKILAYMVTHMNPHTQKPNLRRCSKELSVPYATLQGIWDKRDEMALDIREARQEWIPSVIEACQRVALKAVIQAENKLENAGPGEAAKVAGILIDKQALLSGMPTSIVNSNIANMTDEERRARIDELEKKRAERARVRGVSNPTARGNSIS